MKWLLLLYQLLLALLRFLVNYKENIQCRCRRQLREPIKFDSLSHFFELSIFFFFFCRFYHCIYKLNGARYQVIAAVSNLSGSFIQVATERFSNVKTVRMLVAEEKEFAAYKEKMREIWLIARREGLAKGLMYGGVTVFHHQFLDVLVYTFILFLLFFV